MKGFSLHVESSPALAGRLRRWCRVRFVSASLARQQWLGKYLAGSQLGIKGVGTARWEVGAKGVSDGVLCRNFHPGAPTL